MLWRILRTLLLGNALFCVFQKITSRGIQLELDRCLESEFSFAVLLSRTIHQSDRIKVKQYLNGVPEGAATR
jgi:hypothetical protein